ncbi:MAG TPA: T9SS type A sorting domain-containing protein [Bacteroidia bacterium]|nr:T9SS type A sorting domain-containing protein [Bacteroidia bacterium]
MKFKYYPFLSCLFFFNSVFGQSDSPCQAPILTVNSDTCIFISGTTAGAQYQTDPANGGIPSCAFPGSPDVWYAVIVPASGAIAFTTEEGTITDGGLAVYSGPCTQPQLIECDDDAAAGMMPVVDRSDFNPGDTLFVRFWKAAGNGTGTFSLCAIESHSDCPVAQGVCETTRVNGNAYGPGSNQDAFAYYCDISEFQSHWFRFRFLTNGTFVFTLFPDSIGPGIYPDYDWLLYHSTGSGFCNTFTSQTSPDMCNGSSSTGPSGETGLDPSGTSTSVSAGPGNPFCPVLNVNAGDEYFLLVNNFTTSSSGFILNLGGSAVLDCNIEPTAVNENKTESSQHVYPVPAKEKVCFLTQLRPGSGKWTLRVFDLTGNQVYVGNNPDSSGWCIATSTMGRGIFAYRITDESNQVKSHGKFIVN